MSEPNPESDRRPGLVRRVAAGAWHVPAGFAILLRNPRLWPLATLPVALAVGLMFLGAVLGIFLIPRVEAAFGSAPGAHPGWIDERHGCVPLLHVPWHGKLHNNAGGAGHHNRLFPADKH